MQQPPPNDFADLLGNLFQGPVADDLPDIQPALTELPFSQDEMAAAIDRAKSGKAADDCGVVVEVLKNASVEYLEPLLTLYNKVLRSADVPGEWKQTLS